MAVTVQSFLSRFPEFRSAPSVLDLDAHLSEAIANVDPEIWKARTDQGVELTLAHALALSPFGQNAKLISKTGETTYGIRLDAMKREVSCGIRYL